MAPADLGLAGSLGVGLLLALLQLQLVEPGLEHGPGNRPVLDLGALLLAGHDDVGRDVRDAHRRVRGVDVLAAGTRGAIGVDAAVAFLDVDLDVVVDHREDPDAGKAGVAAGVAVVGRDAHQPVHAGLGLQPAVGVLAGDLQRGGLEARLLACARLHHGHLVAALLAPADVHAGEHLRPILALRAAGTGVHLEIAVVAVGLTGQQGEHLAAASLLGQSLERSFALVDGRLVLLGFAEFDQDDGVVEPPLQVVDAGERFLQPLLLAHEAARFLGIAPEVGVFRSAVQVGEASGRGVGVKDASATGPGTGGPHPRAFVLRLAWRPPRMCKSLSDRNVTASI